MAASCLVRVLGPIDVVSPDGPARVGGRHVRSLLGALVVAAGRAVPRMHLCEVIWGSAPPRSIDNTLQSYVSQLRSVLGSDAVVHVDDAYRLDLHRVEIDARWFEQLLTEAAEPDLEPEPRRARCREALALWRGRPFGDLADDEAFRLEAYRLDELRCRAMELAIGAELELGLHDLVVGELEILVEEYPYREHTWHLLIEALIGSGRRIEARRACARLRDQLAGAGIAVGAELDEYERRIRGDARPTNG